MSVDLNLLFPDRKSYLRLAMDWEDPFPDPVLETVNGFTVVREDLLQVGSKARFADFYISTRAARHFVYPAPRVGFAAVSLALICKRYKKRVSLLVPACAELSDYHLAALEYGADIRSVRIASQIVLNSYAKAFAARAGAESVPLGLHHELITAALVKVAYNVAKKHGEPKEVWTVAGSGVLTRGLQIAWPSAKFFAVSVGHKLTLGESGRATVIKYPRDFNSNAKIKPPFPCVSNYDAKCWEIMQKQASKGALFWNVAGPAQTKLTPAQFKSDRPWGDFTDLVPSNPGITL